MEMLIVVAIIAVLVAVAIPVYTSQMHKVRVAADLANVRAYYAQIQADYMLTEKQNSSVPIEGKLDKGGPVIQENFVTITFLDGAKVKLQEGTYVVDFNVGKGYAIRYECNNQDCTLNLGRK